MKDEYIRKQAALDALPKPQICEYMDEFGAGRNSCAYDAEKAIKDVPAADVVQVVRCKDCKHHAYDEIFSCYWCEYPGRVRETTPDGFGEKGEE